MSEGPEAMDQPLVDSAAMEEEDGGRQGATRGGGARGVLEFVIIFAVALGIALVLRTFVVEPYEVPTGSMEPTIESGNMILAEKVSIDPQYGDIVTFADPTQDGRTLVKRVIATAGQTVDLRDGTVYVDGSALSEDYVHGKRSDPLPTTMPGVSISYPYTVPDGCIWVMGDNRTNSSDSRYFGAVPVRSVTGEGFFTYWPLSEVGVLR